MAGNDQEQREMREKQRLASARYRKSFQYDEEKKEKYNEQAKLRMRKYRQKRKSQIHKRLTRKDRESLRSKWRLAKQKQRANMSEQQMKIVNERRRLYRREAIKRKLNFESLDQPDSKKRRLRGEELYQNIVEATPKTIKTLKNEGLIVTPKSIKQAECDKDLRSNLRQSIAALREKRTKKSRQKQKIIVEAAARKAHRNTMMRESLNVHQHFWNWATNCDVEYYASTRCDSLPETEKDSIESFFRSNAEMLPCKRTITKDDIQKVILTKTVKELYHEYCSNQKDRKVSYSQFKKSRPNYCLTVNCHKFAQCLCEFCINVEFALQALKKAIHDKESPAEILSKFSIAKASLCEGSEMYKCRSRECHLCGTEKVRERLHDVFKDKLQTSVMWNKWERGKIAGMKRQILKDKNGTVKELIEDVIKQLEGLPEHLYLANWHRQLLEDLKAKLPENSVVTLADYAENYRCLYQKEIQAAHYSYTQVTLIPIIAYFSCPHCNELCSFSAVFVSPELSHDAFLVHQCTKKLLSHLEDKYEIKVGQHIQFSDGCAAQFKSKTAFHLMEDKWQKVFFGSRHGKNLCDGLGGLVKAKAELHVKSGAGNIRDASEFFEFCCKTLTEVDSKQCTHKQRMFFYVEDIEKPELPDLMPLQKTQKMHQVEVVESGIRAREYACFCDGCRKGCECINAEKINSTWTSPHNLYKHEPKIPEKVKKPNRKLKRSKKLQESKEKEQKVPEKVKQLKGRRKKSGRIQGLKEKELKMSAKAKPHGTKGKKKRNKLQQKLKRKEIQSKKEKNIMTSEECLDFLAAQINNVNFKNLVCTLADHAEPPNVQMVNKSATGLKKAIDSQALELMPNEIKDLFPLNVYGDGNCLARCAALYGYGTEEKYADIKLLLGKEMIINEDYYIRNFGRYAMYSIDFEPGMSIHRRSDVKQVFEKEVIYAIRPSAYLSMFHVVALANVLKCSVQSVYPKYAGHLLRDEYHTLIQPQNLEDSEILHIMWSSTSGMRQRESQWVPNHFVPLVPLTNERNDVDSMIVNDQVIEQAESEDNGYLLLDSIFEDFPNFDQIHEVPVLINVDRQKPVEVEETHASTSEVKHSPDQLINLNRQKPVEVEETHASTSEITHSPDQVVNVDRQKPCRVAVGMHFEKKNYRIVVVSL